MVSLKEVANKAGVSIATASLALNNSELVNKKTKEKVIVWAKKLKYFPNIHAKNLVRRKSYNLLVMLNHYYFLKSPKTFYLRVIGGIIKESEHTDYALNFTFYSNNSSIIFTDKKIDVKNIDGIIIIDVIDENILRNLRRELAVPILLIDNHLNYKNIHGVDNDDCGGAYKATEYLIQKGHRKIGYIGVPDSHPMGRESWKGFKRALSENNLKEFCIYKFCSFGINSGKKAIDAILERGALPTAFFCVDDYIAIGALEQLKLKGYKIPEDVSLIGMDDMEISSEVEPPLTTVRIKMEEIGNIALNKLISIVNKEYHGDIKTIVTNEIIERDSIKKLIQ